jgi:signal transduction histidine kinase
MSLILIVDDNPNNTKVLFELLKQAGYRVLVAKSGESALERLQSVSPDLILLDVMMPGVDGFETCRRLKASPATQNIPTIFMTALSDATDKVKGLSLGAVDYITKPFQQEEVLARVNIHLKLYHLNRELEQRVAERTAELSIALTQLKQSQLLLVHSEKMSALGQLVAGIVHEIKNPINFVQGNIVYVDEYMQAVLSLLQVYQQHYPNPVPAVQEKAEGIDLSFLLSDLPKTLSSMKLGTDRIYEIVLSLRNFSRLDESELKLCDIHAGIDSTLLILQHRLKAKPDRPDIKAIKEYGALPEVECYPGQLNQVFMNLLANAIDALEESMVSCPLSEASRTKGDRPTIGIRTELIDGDRVCIRIADNGLGMTEEVKDHLFDPFFTTKPVGKGTGLGLPISYQIIVEKHKGQLECISAPGQGTEFVITIPVRVATPAIPKIV